MKANLEYFTSRLSKDTIRDLKKYAADKDKKVYQALEEVIQAGIKANKKAGN